MKLEKKHWVIIGIVIALIAVWYFFLRKKKTNESSYDSNLLIYGSGMGAPSESGYSAADIGGYESGYRSTALSGPVTRKTLLGSGTPTDFKYYKSKSGSCFHTCEELPASGGGTICKCPDL